MLENKIYNLITRRTEGGYWDFKEKWHSDNVDLLHDIICMANNLHDCDAYLIMGVDNNGNVCGVPDENRKNQQQLTDFLKDKKFAGGIRPNVFVQTIGIDDKPVDVIIIENTANTPYYLAERVKQLCAGNIYTRIVDVNTAKDGNADIDKVEWLWKKRFGLVGNSGSKLKRMLMSDGWICEDKGEHQEHFFNEYYPEVRIDINEDETAHQKKFCTAHDSFFYLYADIMHWNWSGDEKLTRKCYDIKWHGNRIKTFYTISAPKMYYDFVEPDHSFLDRTMEIPLSNCNGSGLGANYSYFMKDSIKYLLYKTLIPLQDSTIDRESLCLSVIPVFEDKGEYNAFMEYVMSERKQFKSDFSKTSSDGMFTGGQVKADSRIEQSIRLGKLLVEWLSIWRSLAIAT